MYLSYASVVEAKEVEQILAFDLIVQILDEGHAVSAGRKLGQQRRQISIMKQIGEEGTYEKLVFALTSRMTLIEAFASEEVEPADADVSGCL